MRTIATMLGLAPLLLLAAGGMGEPVAAQQAQGIVVESAWARSAPMMGQAMSGHGAAPAHGTAGAMRGNGAAYVTLRNDGAGPDVVVSVTSDAAATAEVHEVLYDAGVMRMRPAGRLSIPAGGRIEMKPGAHHIMLLGLTRDLTPGDTVKLTLTLEKGGTLAVEAPVR
jgi:copper(I)-binding protein